MPLLISGGDSFTWGNDLRPGPDGYSHQNWSYLISQKLNMDYQCVAKPGGSNSAVCRRIIREITQQSLKNNDIYVAVMWTFTHREEIRLRSGIFPFNTHNEFELDNNWINFTPWHGVSLDERLQIMNIKPHETDRINFYTRVNDTLEKTGVTEAARHYYKVTGDHLSSYFNSIKEIVILQSFLESKNIPYFFCAVSNEVFGITKREEINNKELSKYGLPSIINWNKWYKDNSFYEWSKENKYPIIGTHPNADAHKDWVQLILPKVKECWQI